MCYDVGFDRVIKRTGHLTMVEAESDGNDKIAILLGGVHNRMAVGKMKIGGGKYFEFVSFSVVNAGGNKSVGNILAVGTDILNGSGAGKARDFT